MHTAVDTIGHLLVFRVTPADAQDRDQGAVLTAVVQRATSNLDTLTFVDHGDTGQPTVDAAAAHGIAVVLVTLPDSKRGFVLLPPQWVVERRFA